MDEKLDRRELPIQSVYWFKKMNLDDLTATVPVHLDILKLPVEVKTNLSLIDEARETVKAWYEEDMAYHLKCLETHGDDPYLVRGFERFDDNWVLGGFPDISGFLELSWKNNGVTDYIRFLPIPVFLYNQWDKDRKFYTPESALTGNLIECFPRNLHDPESVFMQPEKMKKYGIEHKLGSISVDKGVAEVQGHAFCSDYQPNMGKALLLRDFAVFYLNKLLDKAIESSIQP